MAKTTPVKPIPEGYHTLTPYITVNGASKAIEFYKKAFGAEELFRMPTPDGKIVHAEIRIGDSNIMLSDEFPEMGATSPLTLKGTPVSLMIYVKDVDTTAKNAVAAGAKVKREVANQFYGDRSGVFQDPFGHVWNIATHVEDIPPAEMEKRAKEHMAKSGKKN